MKIVDELANLATGTAVYTGCTHSTGNTCSEIAACTDIPSPTS